MLMFFWKSSAGHGRGSAAEAFAYTGCTSAAPAVLSPRLPLPLPTVGFQPERNLSRRTGCALALSRAALARGLQEVKVAFGAIHHGVPAEEH